MSKRLFSSLIGILSIFHVALAAAYGDERALTLSAAERLAEERAPALARQHANRKAAAERAVSDGQLPDPQLVFGAINVPTDNFKFNQEDMTMTMVGVRQAFPPGNTLTLKSQRAEKDLAREEAKLENERRMLIKQVRQAWFELYYQTQSLTLLEETRRFQRAQLAAAENRYRVAADMQQALMRARQAVARVDEREPMIVAQIARARAQLRRWIGDAAELPMPAALALLPPLRTDFDVNRHPEWLAAQAMNESAHLEVSMAREEYKPGWMIDISYGYRRPMPDGSERANMLTAMVTLDLPIFRAKRQDRRLAERLNLEHGARLEAEDKRLELEAMERTMRAEQAALASRIKIYDTSLLPALRRETEVTVAGFARDQTEYREAQMRLIEAKQEYIRLQTDLAKVHAELLYLAGEQT